MLFNSYHFIFLFLPVVVFVYYYTARVNHVWALAWLALASTFFYGWWNPKYLVLLYGSIGLNYAIGVNLIRVKNQQSNIQKITAKQFLIIGLIFNISLLFYYKYSDFLIINLNLLMGSSFDILNITLPLGISFFTFTQIAFLVDAYRGGVKSYKFLHYVLFITYFPHLIAGPILHHSEIIPQFNDKKTFKLNYENIAVGLTVFFIGLFKKTVFADSIAPHANVIFSVLEQHKILTFFEAWFGGLCYICQLYFDFSGYSDMALGASLLFGIKLPLNFHSPYKATNISEFWKRWHITLSRFLRDYIYSPLSAGSRNSRRLLFNLFITMVIAGIWHGSGWNFLLWGALQGAYLVIYQYWKNFRRILGHDIRKSTKLGNILACTLTVSSFAFSSALFRTRDLTEAKLMFQGFLGMNGIAFPLEWRNYFSHVEPILSSIGIEFVKFNSKVIDTGFTSEAIKVSLILSFVIWLMPNTQQIMEKYEYSISKYPSDKLRPLFTWNISLTSLILTTLVAIVAITYITKLSEFLYYQF